MPCGKELVRDALAGLERGRVPFVPLVEAFAAKHLQVPVREFYGNAAILAKGLDLARRLTNADAVVCLPDVTLLAEACGYSVSWQAEGPRLMPPPTGITVGAAPADVLARGRIPVVLDALDRLRYSLGQQWALFGALTGPCLLARQLWRGDVDAALDAGESAARELIEAATALCVQLAHRLGELELDGCLVMDGSDTPEAPTAAAAASSYDTLAGVLAFYGCTPIYHGPGLDWLLAQGVSSFEVLFPTVESQVGATDVDCDPRKCAALSDALLRQPPQSVRGAVADLVRGGARMLSTARSIPCDIELASVQAVSV